MLSEKEILELKKQLHAQIAHLPEIQRIEAEEQIDDMSSEALEEMLEKQREMMKNRKSVFRMIVEGELPTRKIEENKDAIAVLDIKPVSKGHMIIIPIKPVSSIEQISPATFELAKELAKKTESRLKAKETRVETEKRWGEVVINIIPQYEHLITLESPRYEAKEEELEGVVTDLKQVQIVEVPKEASPVTKSSPIKLKRRVP